MAYQPNSKEEQYQIYNLIEASSIIDINRPSNGRWSQFWCQMSTHFESLLIGKKRSLVSLNAAQITLYY